MDGIRQLQQIVLTVGIVEVIVREMAKIQIHGQLLAVGKIVDAHAGDDGGAFGLVFIVGNDVIRRIGLRSLEEVRQRIGDAHSVFQHIIADLQGFQQMLEFWFAHGESSLF